MADTVHSVMTGAELHEPKGVASANSGEIYIANGLGSGAWIAPGGAVFGELQVVNDRTTPITVAVPQAVTDIDTASDYTRVNATDLWSNGEADGVTLDATNGYLTIVTAGLYEISYWTSFNADVISAITAFKFSTDDTTGTLSSRRLTRKSGSATDIGVVAASGFVSLGVGDKVSLWAATDSSGVDLTLYDAGITVTLLKAS